MINDANKKTYFSTIDKIEQNSLLEAVFTENISVFMWEEGQDENQLQEFKLTAYDVAIDKYPLKLIGKILSRLLGGDLSSKNIYLKLTYQKIQYFTHGELELDKETSNYFFKPKHTFYKGQKRTNYRLLSDTFINIQIKLNDDVFDCFDLSASGVSLVLPLESSLKYKVGDSFSHSTIRLGKTDFIIGEVTIMGIFDKEQRPEVKMGERQIGMAFSKIALDVEEQLFLTINSEARSCEMRKKFKK